MKKLLSCLIVFFFVTTQAFAKSNQPVFSEGFQQLAIDISEKGLTANEIVARSEALVAKARAEGVSSGEFVHMLSEKMALSMTPQDIAQTVEDLKTDHSINKMNDVAQQLELQGAQVGFVPVLLTFVLLSILWIVIFYILADNPHPGLF